MGTLQSAETSTQDANLLNLPVPILSAFDGDQLSIVLGSVMVDSVIVFDRESSYVVAVNQSFLQLADIDLADFEGREVPYSRFISPDDLGRFRAWLQTGCEAQKSSFKARLVNAGGGTVRCDIRTREIRWQGKAYSIVFAHPCEDRLDREEDLQEQVRLQKSLSKEVLEKAIRVYELNEKIKSTVELTTSLLNVEDEEHLYKDTLSVLMNKEGLNFKEASILVLDGAHLKVVATTEASMPSEFLLAEDNIYSRRLRSGFHRAVHDPRPRGGKLHVPLRSRESCFGMIEVSQHDREKKIYEGSRLLEEWLRDMLTQIGDIVGLLLHNLRLKAQLVEKSITDPLTGAYNRNFFMGRLNSEMRRSARYDRPVSLLFIDVDFFKSVNDDYGHLQGDNVLRDLGVLFRDVLRDNDVVCRYGGDEFVVILPETDKNQAAEAAEKIRLAVKEFHFPNIDSPTQRIPLTVSLGSSTLHSDQSREQFLHDADAALYVAKQAGRDRAR